MARRHALAHAIDAPLLYTFPPWPEEAFPGLPVPSTRWRLSEDDEVSASRPQTLAIRRLWPCVERRLAELDRDWLVGTDQTMHLDPDDLRVGVRPDLYVLPGQPAIPIEEGWPAYQPGVPPPILAVEIVSPSNWGKDYQEAPQRYATLGTEELVLFDPGATRGTSPAPNPRPLQVYRKTPQGSLWRVYAGDGPAWSEVLRCWLVADEGELALSHDEAGTQLILTPEEGEARWKQQAEEAAAARLRAERQAEEATAARLRAEQQAEEATAARLRAEEALQEALARLALLEKKPGA